MRYAVLIGHAHRYLAIGRQRFQELDRIAAVLKDSRLGKGGTGLLGPGLPDSLPVVHAHSGSDLGAHGVTGKIAHGESHIGSPPAAMDRERTRTAPRHGRGDLRT